MNQQRRYLSYLLRLWQAGGGSPTGDPQREPPLWRASLERPQASERLGFASLVDLFAFLEKETGLNPADGERSDEERSPG